jgi:hypothetical protein
VLFLKGDVKSSKKTKVQAKEKCILAGPSSGNSLGGVGGVRSFQPTDQRACADHMLAMIYIQSPAQQTKHEYL